MASLGTVLASRYRLIEQISRTTSSEVWRARDEVLDRAVAVKVQPMPGPTEFDATYQRARALASVYLPVVVDVLDFGAEPGVGAYLVMELVEGTTLDATLASTPALPGRTLELVAQVAEGLAVAHARGVVHGRLTPRRILVRPDGAVTVVGFDLTGAPGLPAGPYPADYVSPEQAMGGVATPASDVYALGVIAYRCLTGDLPFTSLDPAAQAMHHARDLPPPLPPAMDPAIRALVERAMAKPPSQRPSAAEFAREARAAAGLAGAAPPPSQPPQAAPPTPGALPPTVEGAPPAPGGLLPEPAGPEPWGPPELGARRPGTDTPVWAEPPDDRDRSAPEAPTGAYGPATPGYAPVPAAPAQRGPGAPRPAGRAAAPPPVRAAPAADGRLQFAAAYPPAVERARPYPFLFFVHRPDAWLQVQELIGRRAAQLGGQPTVSQGEAAQEVPSGTTLTIVPNVLGAVFEPARMDVVVGDTVRELTFHLAVPPDTPLGTIDGYIDIFIGPLVIGQVPVAFDIQATAAPSAPAQPDGATLLTVANASIFDRIFISYSRRDSEVVDLCVLTYQGLGVRVLVDRLDLRSGDDWRAGLERMIHEADIFQLYWSSAAAASSEVHHEWRLALGLGKTRDRFIRPLYWETPMPPTPEALGHLHFSHLDLKQLRRAAKPYAPGKPGLLRRALTAVLGTKAT